MIVAECSAMAVALPAAAAGEGASGFCAKVARIEPSGSTARSISCLKLKFRSWFELVPDLAELLLDLAQIGFAHHLVHMGLELGRHAPRLLDRVRHRLDRDRHVLGTDRDQRDYADQDNLRPSKIKHIPANFSAWLASRKPGRLKQQPARLPRCPVPRLPRPPLRAAMPPRAAQRADHRGAAIPAHPSSRTEPGRKASSPTGWDGQALPCGLRARPSPLPKARPRSAARGSRRGYSSISARVTG